MRTKTLLLSAVALAAGLVSTQAQSNVYSVNVVGYYNTTVPGTQFAMISTQLPVAGTDSGVNSTLTNGVAEGSVLFLWDGTGYQSIQFFEGFGWFDAEFNLATNTVPPGLGAFIQNGSATEATITVVGQVPQGGPLPITVVSNGFGVYSLPTSISTNIDSAGINFPASEGDLFFRWNKANQEFDQPYQFFEGFGWFDPEFTQVFPTPDVGEGFFLQHAGGDSNWVASFTVQ